MKSLFKTLLAAAISAAAGFTASAQMSFQIGATIPFQRQLRLDPLGLADRYGLGAYAGFEKLWIFQEDILYLCTNIGTQI